MSFNYDPDSCIQDADIEMSELAQTGAHYAALRRKGICPHTWVMAPDVGTCRCNDCGKTWPTRAQMEEEQDELMN